MSEKLLQNRKALCNIVRRIALEAGEATLEFFDESGYDRAVIKQDGSPVTEADQAAEDIITKGLLALLPDIPVIGEEAVANGITLPDPKTDLFWLVDPVDGTKEFISGSGEYTVNIGLIEHGVPVLGVVYAPWTGELYAAHGPGTAIRWHEDSGKERMIQTRDMPREGLTVMTSRSHGSSEDQARFFEQFKVAKVIKRGSSLKMCAIAAGKADLYPRFGPTHEWDTAAAHAVLSAAGGQITDLNGAPLVYGKPGVKNPDIVAWGFEPPQDM